MVIREPRLTFSRPLRPRTTTTQIVVHHTASGDVSAETVHGWHSRKRGWGGIGYHYLIRQNGAIERGRPEQMRGVHASRVNANSIGIALAGNFETRAMPDVQLVSLAWLIRSIRGRHPHWRDLPVVGHSGVGATACPGRLFPWVELRRRLAAPP